MAKEIVLKANTIKEDSYNRLSLEGMAYYTCELKEIPRLNELFPEMEYFKTHILGWGKGISYKEPVYLRNMINMDIIDQEVRKLAKSIDPYSTATTNRTAILEKELSNLAEAVKERTPMLKRILGPWIIKWFDEITNQTHDANEIKAEFDLFAKKVNFLWCFMQTGCQVEDVRLHLESSKLPALDNTLLESVCRGYKVYQEAIKPFLKSSEHIFKERLAIAYALNNEGSHKDDERSVHGNMKITDYEILAVLKKNRSHIQEHSSKYFHHGERLKGQPNISQLTDLIIKDLALDLEKRTLQGRLKKLKAEVIKIVK